MNTTALRLSVALAGAMSVVVMGTAFKKYVSKPVEVQK